MICCEFVRVQNRKDSQSTSRKIGSVDHPTLTEPKLMNPELIPRPYLTLVEASIYMGGTPLSTLRQLAYQRRIPSYKPSKRLLFRQSDLDDFVEASRRASIDQLNKQLEQKRQELNGPNAGGAVKGRGNRS